MQDLQARATLSNHLPRTRNEQVSGSSPLVGSLFFADLQENAGQRQCLGMESKPNLLQPVRPEGALPCGDDTVVRKKAIEDKTAGEIAPRQPVSPWTRVANDLKDYPAAKSHA